MPPMPGLSTSLDSIIVYDITTELTSSLSLPGRRSIREVDERSGKIRPPICYPNEVCAHRFSCCLSLRSVWPLCHGRRSLKQARRCLLMTRTHPEAVIGKLTSLGRFHRIEPAVFLELRCWTSIMDWASGSSLRRRSLG